MLTVPSLTGNDSESDSWDVCALDVSEIGSDSVSEVVNDLSVLTVPSSSGNDSERLSADVCALDVSEIGSDSERLSADCVLAASVMDSDSESEAVNDFIASTVPSMTGNDSVRDLESVTGTLTVPSLSASDSARLSVD